MKRLCILLASSIIFITSLLGATAFAGCGTAEKFDPDALTVMGKTSDLNKTYMTRIFDLYRQSTGENLNILKVNDGDFEEESLRLEKSGGLPDVYLHFNNADLTRLDVGDNFEYLNGQEWTDGLTDGAKAYCTDADGNLLGLPFWENSVSGCYYNKTLLASYGLGAATSQADFDGLCGMLMNRNITPICWPAGGCTWMAQFGLDPIFADDPAKLEKLNKNELSYGDIPEVTDMLSWISGAANRGWFGHNYLETGWNDISPALADGKAAMTFIWDTWFSTDFKAGKYSADDFALMPIFMNTADGGTYEGGNLNMMMVNKNSPKKQKALNFLSFCADPDNYNVAFKDIATVSVFKGQTTNIQSPMVTDALQSIQKHERVSTADPKIIGYSAEKVDEALAQLLRGGSVAECLAKLDADRRTAAKISGAAGF